MKPIFEIHYPDGVMDKIFNTRNVLKAFLLIGVIIGFYFFVSGFKYLIEISTLTVVFFCSTSLIPFLRFRMYRQSFIALFDDRIVWKKKSSELVIDHSSIVSFQNLEGRIFLLYKSNLITSSFSIFYSQELQKKVLLDYFQKRSIIERS